MAALGDQAGGSPRETTISGSSAVGAPGVGFVDLLLIRHGECEMNLALEKMIGGRAAESPLTRLGEEQARVCGLGLAKLLEGVALDRVYASTATRAKDTARLAIAELSEAQYPGRDILLEEDITEMTQGSWEGRPRAECYTKDVMNAIRQDPENFAAPLGESKRQVQDRVLRVLDQVTDPALGFKCVALFGHGVAWKCFVRFVVDGEWAASHQVPLGNAGIIHARRNVATREWAISTLR